MNVSEKIQTNFNRMFYRIDKNLRNNKEVVRKVNLNRNIYTITIPPVLYDMLKTNLVTLKPSFDLEGNLNEITIKPYFENENNK